VVAATVFDSGAMFNGAKQIWFCFVIQTFLFAGLTRESNSDSLTYMSDLEIYRLIGSRIAARRKDLRLKQVEVAAQIGLTRASLANIEKGRQKIMLHQIYRIAEALRVESIIDLVPLRFSTSEPDEPIIFVESDMREDLRVQAEQFIRRTPIRR
jgi:transcriptional regulator with XRE-family HTH domain